MVGRWRYEFDSGNCIVSQWNDKSGSGNHLTPNGSSDPMSGTATLNELNVIEFDGNDILTTDSLNDVNNSDQTWFIVARVDIGGVSNAGDGIIAYDQWAEGNWQIQASNTSQFRGRVRKNISGSYVNTSNFQSRP